MLASQAMRITTAIHLFVVMQAHIQYQRTHLLALNQHVRTRHRVATHRRKLAVGQLIRLVQYVIGNGHFADVMQQAGEPSLTHLHILKTKLTRQRNHQRTYSHRMHIGVFIGIFQPRQANQCIGVPHNRIGNFFNQLAGLFELQCLAHARIAKHADNCRFGIGAELNCTLQFIVHRHRSNHRRVLHNSHQLGVGLCRHLFGAGTCSPDFNIQPFTDIDPQLTDAAGLDPQQIFLGFQQKLGLPEGMVHP